MAQGGHSFAALPRASRTTHLLKAGAHTASIPFHAVLGTLRAARSGVRDIVGRNPQRKRRPIKGVAKIAASPIHGSIMYGGAAASRALAHYARSFRHEGVHLSNDAISFSHDDANKALIADAESRQ